MKNAIFNETLAEINRSRARSAWEHGVREYAEELLEQLDDNLSGGYFTADELASRSRCEKILLNGSSDWHQYSWDGNSSIYNEDVAKRLCSPSELKRCKGGFNEPNKSECWLDVQARALFQAANLILKILPDKALHSPVK